MTTNKTPFYSRDLTAIIKDLWKKFRKLDSGQIEGYIMAVLFTIFGYGAFLVISLIIMYGMCLEAYYKYFK